MAWLVCLLEVWIVQGLGEVEDVESILIIAHFGACLYVFSDDADSSDSSISMRHRFE